MNREDIIWLAGLLDAEACFRINHGNSPQIALSMSDKDLIERTAFLWGSNIAIRKPRYDNRPNYIGNKWKTMYTTTINGRKAVIFMKELLAVNRLGKRRTAKILEIIQQWENRPVKRLSPEQVFELRNDFQAGMSSKELSKKYKITPESINRRIKDLRKRIEVLV